VELALGLIALAINIALVVTCFMKGKYIFGVIGIFSGLFSLIGAIRLAKPNSSWARDRYNDAKMAASGARYPDLVAA